MTPGEHLIADKDPDNHIGFAVKSGSVYYIRGEWVENGLLGFNTRFSIVGTETATGDLRRLKVGDRKQIQNHRIALIEP